MPWAKDEMNRIAKEKNLRYNVNSIEIHNVEWDGISANEFINWVKQNTASNVSLKIMKLFGVPTAI